MDKETLERVNQPVAFAEYPKMLHHPDGSQKIVNSSKEESKAGSDWMSREDAVAERDKRDKRDAEMAARLAVTGKPDASRTDVVETEEVEVEDVDAAGKPTGTKRKVRVVKQKP